MGEHKRLNIIFILVDTLRADKLGCYGGPKNISPNIDRLAKEGVLFENTYATINKTDPSILAIFSGRYPLSTGLINHGARISSEEEENIAKIKVLPEMLKEAGYHTAAVDWLGRFHRRGYDFYSGFVSEAEPKTILGSKIYHYLRLLDLGLTKTIGRDFLARLFYGPLGAIELPYDPADVVTEKGIERVKERKRAPFFLYLHYWDPHFPYSRPNTLKSLLLDKVETRYEAEVSFVDGQIGKFLDFLREEKLLDKTLLILTGDHGEGLNEHGVSLAHRSLYEMIVKVPLMIHGPGLNPQRVKYLTQHPDIVPTILNFLNLDRLGVSFDGENLLPLINAQKTPARSLAFFEDISPGEFYFKKDSRSWGIRAENYKFTKAFKGAREDLFSINFSPSKCTITKEGLYDLGTDPGEKNNLINKKPGVAEDLARQMNLFVKNLRENRQP